MKVEYVLLCDYAHVYEGRRLVIVGDFDQVALLDPAKPFTFHVAFRFRAENAGDLNIPVPFELTLEHSSGDKAVTAKADVTLTGVKGGPPETISGAVAVAFSVVLKSPGKYTLSVAIRGKRLYSLPLWVSFGQSQGPTGGH